MQNHRLAFCGTIVLICFAAIAASPKNNSVSNEVLVSRAVRALHGAQATYQATSGNGSYGTLEQLGTAQLIDQSLSTGYKYGYLFIAVMTPATPTMPADFQITATPRKYRVYGKISFFIDASGELRGGDKGGHQADASDPIIELCSQGSISDNERCTMQSQRTLHSAETTYQATSGNGNFGTLTQLRSAGLIQAGLASGISDGYIFTLALTVQTQTVPAAFRISAVPKAYGTSGFRSFFISTDGVMYCADKNGEPADENDPPCK